MSTETAFAERWLWLAGSLCIATLATAIRWIMERPHLTAAKTEAFPIPFLRVPWIVQPLRLLYAVGIPATALFWRGTLTTSGLGLQPFFWTDNAVLNSAQAGWDNWVHDIGWTCAYACSLGVLVILADRTAKRLSTHNLTTHHSLGYALLVEGREHAAV